MKINWALLSNDSLPCIDGSFSLIRVLHTIYVEEHIDKAPFVFFTMEVAINKDEKIENVELVIQEDENTILTIPSPPMELQTPGGQQDDINFIAFCARFGGYNIKVPCKYKAFARVNRKGESPLVSQVVDYSIKISPALPVM
jgi:hypothetical protein